MQQSIAAFLTFEQRRDSLGTFAARILGDEHALEK
jgi:hypothetical protein